VSKAYGDNLLIENLSFALPAGGIVGIIGPNGAGKTTMFRMITGQEKPDSGTIGIGETGEIGLRIRPATRFAPEKAFGKSFPTNRIRFCWAKEKSTRGRMWRGSIFQARISKRKSGCFPAASATGFIWQECSKPARMCFLLDEPTNDLDVNTLRALEEALENFAGCAAVISHDRWFLDRIATHILAFESDSKAIWFDGNYSEYEADRKARTWRGGLTSLIASDTVS